MQQYLLEFHKLCVWLLALLIIFVPLEKLFGRRKQKVLRKEFFTDLGYYFINNFFPQLLLIVPLSILIKILYHFGLFPPHAWMNALSSPSKLLLAIIVGELGAYWGHRWSHEIPTLWRFHSIHHSAEEMDWLVNSRAHPVDMAFTRFCGLVPICVLGLASGATPWLYLLVVKIWSFLVHANIRWRFGFLEKLVVSPAFHHWHHTNDGPEYINKNYAAIFPWVDKIFGTLYLPRSRWPDKYGIDEALDSSLVGQLLHPVNGK